MTPTLPIGRTVLVKSVLARILPSHLVEALRQLRSLDTGARRIWLRLAARRLLGGQSSNRIPRSLPSHPKVVVLCYGNIYRSPMAEVLLSRALEVAAHGRFHVTSAGLRARDGRESPPDALAVAEELGVSLRDHGARRLTDDIADAADLLVIMDRANEAILLSEFPSVVDKVVLLGFWGLETEGGEDVEIPDPYGTGLETVRACYDRIEQSTAALSRALVAQQP